MTYIKWKDEVESYLGNLSASEKQKVFSYFAEMYADKRDAGISEEKIIEGFGAPYDVAQRILADSKSDTPATHENQNGEKVSGGNNYNYNYYNYNYGGAPSAYNGAQNERNKKTDPSNVDVSDIDMPLPEGTPKIKENKQKKNSALVSVILIIVLAIPLFALLCAGIGVTVGFVAAAAGCIVGGGMTVGEAVGSMVAGFAREQIGLICTGILAFGIGLLFIPLAILVIKLVWKLIAWIFKQFKTLVTA